jgi:hypothetical protein
MPCGYPPRRAANHGKPSASQHFSLHHEPSAFANASGSSYALAAPQSSQLPSLPKLGPNIGTVVGVTVGAAAAGAVAAVLLTRQHGGRGGVLFDTGWQFEMVLESPLSVDAASVAAAAAIAQPAGQ